MLSKQEQATFKKVAQNTTKQLLKKLHKTPPNNF
jgi:hypothetical protein